MQLSRQEILAVVKTLDRVYEVISNKELKIGSFLKIVPQIANSIGVKLYPVFKDDSFFRSLFEHLQQLLSKIVSLNDSSISFEASEIAELERAKLIDLLEKFETSLLTCCEFYIYLHKDVSVNFPLACERVKTVTVLPESIEDLGGHLSGQSRMSVFSVFVHTGTAQEQNGLLKQADVSYQPDYIAGIYNRMMNELKKPDYFMYDRLYLEAKLESLKVRRDIQLLLAGSSYTMCGLLEEEMPLVARNVAVDAQDLYYTLKTIRVALELNPNITHCIISFAYYFWGYDLSLSTSVYQYKRVTEVNYPIFKDRHNFPYELFDKNYDAIVSIPPLVRHIFSLGCFAEQYIKNVKHNLANAHYFSVPRTTSTIVTLDDTTNYERAKQRTASHNKFFKYESTVRENISLFEGFLEEMNRKNVQIILYVPPVTPYYRDSIDQRLISDFYTCMKPFLAKFNFKLVDLFESDHFKNEDFVDYDHLNDQGAKKLGRILMKELNDG
ncbi:hypothetical protein [Alicyclobacillus fodiniaquatilis]|uniref:Uncharacterized protein n=1 Tax=Alicyclobacillus fodiniaquatilis TaxID=1661150 RepID=A0ABW4JJX0_9BACL